MLRFETAGESHGETLVTTLTGLPAGAARLARFHQPPALAQAAGVRPRRADEDRERQGSYCIRRAALEERSALPIAILLKNRDWKNWSDALPVEDAEGSEGKAKPVKRPRPGHADLAGSLKYNFHDARYVLERASARETTSRVAVGALCELFLAQFDIKILSHVIAVGNVALERDASWEELETLYQKDEILAQLCRFGYRAAYEGRSRRGL